MLDAFAERDTPTGAMGIRSPRAALLLAPFALLACDALRQSIADSGKSRSGYEVDNPQAQPTPIDLAALERDVAVVRKLPLVHAIHAEALSDTDFRARVDAATRHSKRATRARDAFWGMLGIRSPDRSPSETERRMVEELAEGLYDYQAKRLYVRSTADDADADRIATRSVVNRLILSHEIVHALQDQHFGLARGDGLNEDQALAYGALVEGDAVVTSYAVEAFERGELYYFLTNAAQPRELAEEMAEHEASPEERRAPPLLRRRLLFPYLEGSAFVLSLYERGEFERIDKAFARPPQSTEQVLHIEKYLTGEQPIPVESPRPPPGWRTIVVGVMGEMQTQVLLSTCLRPVDAAAAGAGWGGDAYAICEDRQQHSAMLWSTVWDDEASAARFERAARAHAKCVGAAPLTPGDGMEVAVERDGTRVAYVQGLSALQNEAVARGLLSLPLERPQARPPF